MDLGQMLYQTSKRWPNKLAIIQDDVALTYDKWNREVNKVSQMLRSIGIKKGDRIATFMYNSWEYVTICLGTQKIGAVLVPLNYRLSAEEIKLILNDCEAKVLIFDSELAEPVSLCKGALTSIEHFVYVGEQTVNIPKGSASLPSILTGIGTAEPGVEVADEDLSIIMYTSGTTGLPKGIMLNHQHQWINTMSCALEMGFTCFDRTLHIAPLYHVAAYHVFFLPHLLVGGTNIILQRFDPKRVFELIERNRVTTLLAVPTQYDLLAAGRQEFDLSSLRLVATTGAPIKFKTVEWVRANVCQKMWNVYGLTESTSLITILSPDEFKRMGEVNCIGRAFLNMEVRLVPPNDPSPDNEVPEGTPGLLITRGPKLMLGIYKDNAKTAESMKEGWLYTGDIARKDSDGYYYLVDRQKDMIISGGENIFPQEVERVLDTHPGVLESAVVGVPDPKWGELVKAFIVAKADNVTSEDIERYCLEGGRLARYKRPRIIEFVREIPKTPSGKILRRMLKTPK